MVQSINVSGILATIKVLLTNPALLRPNLVVKDIREIPYKNLKEAPLNLKAIGFDKDNTLTAPYDDKIHAPFIESFDECKRVFGGGNVFVVSNSAGTLDDVGHVDANAIEKSLGMSFSSLPLHLVLPQCNPTIKSQESQSSDTPQRNHSAHSPFWTTTTTHNPITSHTRTLHLSATDY